MSRDRKSDTAIITPHQLHHALTSDDGAWPKRNWALLDVRELGESQNGHIFSATFLPRRLLEFRIAQLVPLRSTRVIVYDGGAGDEERARYAAATLASHGYRNVACLQGGLSGWVEAGFAVQTGWNVPGKQFGERVLESLSIPALDADELAARLQAGDNIVLLDVRTRGEHKTGTLPESISAPSFDWLLAAEDLLGQHDEVVLHCAGRTRSIIAAATAERLGLHRIRFLENGTMGWLLKDRELVAGRDSMKGGEWNSALIQHSRRLARDAGAEPLQCGELKERLDRRSEETIYVVDTRRQEDYEAAHIAGAVWLPGGQACQRSDDFIAVPSGTIVFVDDGDLRAWITAYWFCQMGFEHVFVLEGHTAAWTASGLAVRSGRERAVPLGLQAARCRVPALTLQNSLSAILARESCRAVIIDVGTSRHFARQHVRAAHWVPRGSLEARIGALADRETRIIVTAWDPDQAALAASTLADRAYSQVSWLDVPGAEWSGHLPVGKGMPPEADPPNDQLDIPYQRSKEAMARYLDWEVALRRP